MAPVAPKMTKAEEATALRRELEEFCNDFEALKKFYEQVTPRAPGSKNKDKSNDASDQDKEQKPIEGEGSIEGNEENGVAA